MALFFIIILISNKQNWNIDHSVGGKIWDDAEDGLLDKDDSALKLTDLFSLVHKSLSVISSRVE